MIDRSAVRDIFNPEIGASELRGVSSLAAPPFIGLGTVFLFGAWA